ncbi:LysM peptidoglycan-binding domain-containing protein [Alkalihalobacillus sp. MEB130]|uniref:LysM peptidoglycan-binding domain-containing protein n=1 Tax=Alkalihalobacillus sp. MEB130 TaxID=2976704 RepID=UPI0028E010F3|nr:LysM peptidoglycan-binding domain-containing protein [Alkalihalobacillus sp. MEB130]MDT8859677.1 LysM peptidoglycan-binding domain-containing protein [Alkalihalobacillus sp. MEB130]
MANIKRSLKMTVVGLCLLLGLGFSQNVEAEMYEVKHGDTLYRIALEKKITVSKLKEMNSLTSNLIYPGQKLLLNDEVLEVHQVVRGDTLYSISKKYNMTVDQLKKDNNLTTTLIFPGQTLKVRDRNTIYYEVKKGDTLYSISKVHQIKVDELKQRNKLITNIIFPGQSLVIPVTYTSNIPTVNVEKDYQFVMEEPRTYQLFSKKDPSFFVRMQVLDSPITIAKLKSDTKQYLESVGPVTEVKQVQSLHPFYKNANVYMISSNSEVRHSVVIKEINGQTVRFFLHLPDKEEAEYYTPRLLDQLLTIKF